jgi:hypothetical protein
MVIKEEDRDKVIKKFAQDSAALIWGLASVPDNWINQLKVYRNLDISDEVSSKAAYVRMLTTALYLDLLSSRTSDLLNNQESHLLEYESKKHYIHMVELVEIQGKDEKDKKEGANEVYRLLDNLISDLRSEARKNNTTVIEVYINYLNNSLGDYKNSSYFDVAKAYAESKIELYEEQNFRKQLKDLLN